MTTVEFESKAPYYFSDVKIALKKNGELRQSKKLISLIKKHYSAKTVMCGIPKYYMRVDSYQFQHNGNVTVIVAVPDLQGGFIVKFL